MYAIKTQLAVPFDEAVDQVTQALRQEGFGIISDVDIAATLKAKIGVARRPYRILGACNPGMANQALLAEPDIGLLLPCNVVVREEDDGTVTVALLNPEAVLNLADRPAIRALGQEALEKLRRVAVHLEGGQAGEADVAPAT